MKNQHKQIRENGQYFIKTKGSNSWELATYTNGFWYVRGSNFSIKQISLIDEVRVLNPDERAFSYSIPTDKDELGFIIHSLINLKETNNQNLNMPNLEDKVHYKLEIDRCEALIERLTASQQA